jgi:uncharacterized protein
VKATIDTKKKKLAGILKRFDKLAVALSGGVDSAVLLAEAHAELGHRVIAITASSPIHPQQDLSDASKLCADLRVPHLIVKTFELTQKDFQANTPQRCYICKMNVFGCLLKRIKAEGIDHLVHGANADDLADYRPGLQAATELGVGAPLMAAGLSKREIRSLARSRGLNEWNKPAMACFATRIPYGTRITRELIEQVKQAETVLENAGVRGCRVRHHGAVARIEAPLAHLSLLISDPMRQRLADKLRQIGFNHVCLDLEGYVTGSMNRFLSTKDGPL